MIKPIKDSLPISANSRKEVRSEEATMEDVLKKAYELGAEKAKIIGTETIIMVIAWTAQRNA